MGVETRQQTAMAHVCVQDCEARKESPSFRIKVVDDCPAVTLCKVLESGVKSPKGRQGSRLVASLPVFLSSSPPPHSTDNYRPNSIPPKLQYLPTPTIHRPSDTHSPSPATSPLQCGNNAPRLPASFPALASHNNANPPPAPAPSPPTPSALNLHPRIAVLLGIPRRWHIPLLISRALSTLPAAWWGLRCALTFLRELLLAAAAEEERECGWEVERRFRVTEVALAILWCSASAYLSYFFTDCLMARWLQNYTPSATIVRLLTTNALIAYITSWVLYLSGASEDPRLLLPAWVAIATTLTLLYHLTHHTIASLSATDIKRETSASVLVFSVVSFVSMSALLLQLHLTRENEPVVPAFVLVRKGWEGIMGGRVDYA